MTVVLPLEPKWVGSPPYVAVIVWTPALVPVYVTEQLATPVVAVGASGHAAGANVPPELLVLQVTVPVGVVFVPPAVSLTVAVQLTGPPAWVVLGVQLTAVEVVRLVTFTSVLPELVLCVESPP